MIRINVIMAVLLAQMKYCISVDIIDQSPDEMLEELIGDIHELRSNKTAHEHLFKNLGNYREDYLDYKRTLNILSTTPSTDELKVGTTGRPPELRPLTMKQIKQRILLRDLNRMLKDSRNPMENPQGDIDETIIITRRFAEIQRRYPNKPAVKGSLKKMLNYPHKLMENPQGDVDETIINTRTFAETQQRDQRYPKKPALRGPGKLDHRVAPGNWQWSKWRITNIMLTFVHMARFKLTYVQALRKKYYDSLRYKLGYCFSLLAQLRRLQERMVTAYVETWGGMHVFDNTHHLRVYERVNRLNTDIKDLIKHIENLERKRSMLESPEYYEFLQYLKRQEIRMTRSRRTRKGLGKLISSTPALTLPDARGRI